jgi:hypothetical protein
MDIILLTAPYLDSVLCDSCHPIPPYFPQFIAVNTDAKTSEHMQELILKLESQCEKH